MLPGSYSSETSSMTMQASSPPVSQPSRTPHGGSPSQVPVALASAREPACGTSRKAASAAAAGAPCARPSRNARLSMADLTVAPRRWSCWSTCRRSRTGSDAHTPGSTLAGATPAVAAATESTMDGWARAREPPAAALPGSDRLPAAAGANGSDEVPMPRRPDARVRTTSALSSAGTSERTLWSTCDHESGLATVLWEGDPRPLCAVHSSCEVSCEPERTRGTSDASLAERQTTCSLSSSARQPSLSSGSLPDLSPSPEA
mmetsp:Transcript_20075/g.76965  ORF Transcript_20075/g.76965 Transcript_20075/m.76965 type:complete len:260 (-) Transcript_20075:1961-2740(-)